MTIETFFQLNSIFISILIEAMPFVLLGVFISGIIQIFITVQMVSKFIPKNRILAVVYGTLIGAIFPACECGIIPIVRRLILKGVPLHMGIAFMLTGPVINPIVLFSTYVAFGNKWDIMLYRGGLAIIVSIIVGLILSYQYDNNQLLEKKSLNVYSHDHTGDQHFPKKLLGAMQHAVEEFFSVGKYLIIGAFIAASMQTFIKTSTLLAIGQNELSSSAVMMGLAFILSLCSEADAFIASSFTSTFSTGSIIAFLVYGPMLDIKNTLMLLDAFKKKFVFFLILYITVFVLFGSLLI